MGGGQGEKGRSHGTLSMPNLRGEGIGEAGARSSTESFPHEGDTDRGVHCPASHRLSSLEDA